MSEIAHQVQAQFRQLRAKQLVLSSGPPDLLNGIAINI